MNSPVNRDAGGADVFGEDDLLRLEIQVAQRADELAGSEDQIGATDLERWLRAEHEIFEERFGPEARHFLDYAHG
jgi:hypothetical protein